MTQGILIALAKWLLEKLGVSIYAWVSEAVANGKANRVTAKDIGRIERARKEILDAKKENRPVTNEQRENLKQAHRMLAARAVTNELQIGR